MAPFLSITVECPYRAAHGAVAVRHLHMAPAADARIDKRTRGARGAGRAMNAASRRRAARVRAQRRGADTRARTHITHIQNPTHTIAHTHNHTHNTTPAHTAAP